MRYPQQLVWKQRFVGDALQRIGRVADPPVLPIVPSPLEWGYRNKMEFAFAGQGERLSLGLHHRATHDIVDVTGCLLQTGRTMRVVEAVRRQARRSGLAAWSRKNGGWWRFLVIREPAAGGLYAAILRLAGMAPVRELWDLYCGVGAIGLYLARNLADPPAVLHGIEQSDQAVKLARINAAAIQPQAVYARGDVDRLLGKLAGIRGKAPDLAVVDPPRAGLGSGVTAALCRLRPGRILYVSCDPATLARDAARLTPYRLEAVQPVDLFPQTPHVESVSLFVRG
jgi:tRNA/tmRNA/rRNA uracil-C5-methylase (TrmA/RlmC/RlmD family)